MSLSDIVMIVLPVFAVIGVGFACARARLLSETVGEGLGEFVYTLGVPVLVFRTVATAHFPDLSPWPLWGAYFAGAGIAWAAGSVVATALFGRSRAEGVIAGVSSSFSNTVMVGIPLVVAAFGEQGALPLFIIISVHLPIMMIAGTLMTERAVRLDRGDAEPPHVGRTLARVGRNLATNPLVWALILGAAWRAVGLPLEGVPRTAVDMIAAAGTPAALLSLGMAMNRYGLVGEFRLSMVLTALKLLLMPAAVYLLATDVFGLTREWATVATITAACPSGVNSYIFATRFNVAHATASSSIGLSTLLSVATMLIWFVVTGG